MSMDIMSQQEVAEANYKGITSCSEIVSLYYHPYYNILEDMEGEPFYDIFRIIKPWRYNYLKEVGGTEYVRDAKTGVMYELVFPWEGEDEDEEEMY